MDVPKRNSVKAMFLRRCIQIVTKSRYCKHAEALAASGGYTRGVTMDADRISWAKGWAVQCIKLGSSDYPELLGHLRDPPQQLFVLGNIAALSSPQLAIVGSRCPTQEGLSRSLSFAKRLGMAGLTITSGLAIGIDGAAHRGAIAIGRPSVAVLGGGLDLLYPRRHGRLAMDVLSQGGAIVSEYALGTPPMKHHFLQRNRIISGLSLGVLVVEAGARSGSLNTANHALNQGREVFAIPGPVNNLTARGCHQLIRDGAHLIEAPEQILSQIEMISRGTVEQPAWVPPDEDVLSQIRSESAPQPKFPNPLFLQVLGALSYSPMGVAEIVERTNLTVPAVSTILCALEIEGLIVADMAGFRLAETPVLG